MRTHEKYAALISVWICTYVVASAYLSTKSPPSTQPADPNVAELIRLQHKQEGRDARQDEAIRELQSRIK